MLHNFATKLIDFNHPRRFFLCCGNIREDTNLPIVLLDIKAVLSIIAAVFICGA